MFKGWFRWKGVLLGCLVFVWMFLFIIAGGLIFSSSASAQQWAKTYGGPGDDQANSIQQTRDGGYIVVGVTKLFGVGADDVWVLKLDASGNVQWAKTYGGTDYDKANSIQQTSDGGYIVAGKTSSFGAGRSDAWVLKLDASGNVQWAKTYGGANWDYASSIQQTSDGGYIVAGKTSSFDAIGSDAWVLKLDASGNVQWQKRYGGTNDDWAESIQQTRDGGYIVAGVTKSFGAGGSDAWLLKLDASGNVQWAKTYGGTKPDWASSIQQTRDGGYIVAGGTLSFNAIGSDVWVLKLDASGNVQWQKRYGGTNFDWVTSIQQTRDGGYIVAGVTLSFGAGDDDFWVLKLDANGNVQWQKTYGGTNSDGANFIQPTSDSGYIVAGRTWSFGEVGSDVWVLKLDANGNITGCPVIRTSHATVNTTTATLATTSVTPNDTNATINNTKATITILPFTTKQICNSESSIHPHLHQNKHRKQHKDKQ